MAATVPVTEPNYISVRPLQLGNSVSADKHLAQSEQTIDELTDFRTQALARLAAQHEEITRLRQLADRAGSVRRLPTRTPVIGSCS
jgi:hypothetical protein